MENQELNVTLDIKELTTIVRESLAGAIQKTIAANKTQIEQSLNQYFQRSFFSNKESQFESSLDWAVENVFREGLNQAMEELNFKELIATKAKEILSSNDFIQELAEAKVRSSLGLPPKQ